MAWKLVGNGMEICWKWHGNLLEMAWKLAGNGIGTCLKWHGNLLEMVRKLAGNGKGMVWNEGLNTCFLKKKLNWDAVF